jgi:transcriptional regulator
MYVPSQFRIDDLAGIRAAMRAAPLASLVTAGEGGLSATPLPLFLEEGGGAFGTLCGHIARANPQWRAGATEGMAIFMGPDAYVSPAWYATKRETGKVVPTWNYVAVHASGPGEFIEDPERLLDHVTRLTELHEAGRADPWAVSDAPGRFVAAQLRGIVGVRLHVERLEGKAKLSQNRSAADRAGVAEALGRSEAAADRAVARLIPRE